MTEIEEYEQFFQNLEYFGVVGPIRLRERAFVVMYDVLKREFPDKYNLFWASTFDFKGYTIVRVMPDFADWGQVP